MPEPNCYLVGFLIANLSKMQMYKFWYNYIKNKYNEKAKLCFIDTNGFIIRIKTERFL